MFHLMLKNKFISIVLGICIISALCIVAVQVHFYYVNHRVNHLLKEKGYYPNIEIRFGRKAFRTHGWIFCQNEKYYLTDKIFSDVLPHIKSLNYMGNQTLNLELRESMITNDSIENIGYFPQVSYLDISNTTISEQSINYFSQLPNLQYLNLNDTMIKKDSINSLFLKCPRLQNIYIENECINRLEYYKE